MGRQINSTSGGLSVVQPIRFNAISVGCPKPAKAA